MKDSTIKRLQSDCKVTMARQDNLAFMRPASALRLGGSACAARRLSRDGDGRVRPAGSARRVQERVRRKAGHGERNDNRSDKRLYA
jgi:hypothetical protein